MGKYVSKCVERIHMIGPSPKVMVCPFCNRRRWRQKETTFFFKTNGCSTCRITRKYTNLGIDNLDDNPNYNNLSSNALLAEPRKKCSGRYLVDVPLDDNAVSQSGVKNSFTSSLYSKYGNKTHNPVAFKL